MFAEENGLKGDPRLQAISQAIRVVPHFPKHGLYLSHSYNFPTILFYFLFICYITKLPSFAASSPSSSSSCFY